MAELSGELLIFFRADGWYPIEAIKDVPLAQQAADNAVLNPGTLKVEDMDGNVLWRPIAEAFRRAADHLRSGGVVAIPRAGLGTGLADLPRRAPRIARYIEGCIRRLGEIAAELRVAAEGEDD